MKIWVIGRNFPQKNKTIEGSFELDQARMLMRAGHEVAYLTIQFHPFNKVKRWGSCSFDSDHIPVFAYSQFYPPRRMHIRLEKFQTKTWRKLFCMAEKQFGIPDVIHIHYPTMIPFSEAILEYQEQGVKIIATEHWTKVMTGDIHRQYKKTLSTFVKRADAFICVSTALREGVQHIVGGDYDIKIVPNVVSSCFRPFDTDHSGTRFICIGRLTAVKQIDQIISAFAEQFFGEKDVSLIIVGSGEEYTHLLQLTKQLGVSSQVVFKGSLNREDTALELNKSDVLVCYSRMETFAVPIIEAWACGKPTIVAENIPVLDYWKEDLGRIVPLNDTRLLGEAMSYLKENTSSFNREAISKYALENFSEKVVCDRLFQIYSDSFSKGQ